MALFKVPFLLTNFFVDFAALFAIVGGGLSVGSRAYSDVYGARVHACRRRVPNWSRGVVELRYDGWGQTAGGFAGFSALELTSPIMRNLHVRGKIKHVRNEALSGCRRRLRMHRGSLMHVVHSSRMHVAARWTGR